MLVGVSLYKNWEIVSKIFIAIEYADDHLIYVEKKGNV